MDATVGIGPKNFVGLIGNVRSGNANAAFATVSDGYVGTSEVNEPSIYKCAPSVTTESSGRGYVVNDAVTSHVLAGLGIPAVVVANAQTA